MGTHSCLPSLHCNQTVETQVIFTNRFEIMPMVEKSPNNRAGCQKRGCWNKIMKNTYRVRVGGNRKCKWYHLDCYLTADNVKYPHLTSDFSGYDALPSARKRQVSNVCWPNMVVSKKERRHLKLKKEFCKMKIKDLKFELERRDIERGGNKTQLQNRLQRYLSSRECQRDYDKLVHGYCREKEEKYGLILPIYLTQIVNAYF